MISNNSDQFDKSDRTEDLPLLDMLNMIHEEEFMSEEGLLRMIEDYWRRVKQELVTNKQHRRWIPVFTQNSRAGGFNISIRIEDSPYFECNENIMSMPIGKAAARFLERFSREAVAFVGNTQKRPFNGTQGGRLEVAFTLFVTNSHSRRGYFTWASGNYSDSKTRSRMKEDFTEVADWGHVTGLRFELNKAN